MTARSSELPVVLDEDAASRIVQYPSGVVCVEARLFPVEEIVRVLQGGGVDDTEES